MTCLIEVRVSNLIGAALDWAVAIAEEMYVHIPTGLKHEYWYKDGRCVTSRTSWEPSTCWGQGGPLFDKHLGSAHHNPHLEDGCCRYSAGPAGAGMWLYGPTALIAFCRTLVLTKLGDTVQVPKELLR
ncbi:phage protein NinX family protein [Pseudomonas asiatica]|uniref:phage protein NinX family protein n=1 Tax=Pseudomonas asiatica TaxID=2219225 RepID=UPI00166D0ECB|nr:phage protein NinX family protein [Pseudomonas asiatica]QNT38657.1 DUF2591 family protein [Pseudomonas asiatica]